MNYFDFDTWIHEESLTVPGQGNSQGHCRSLVSLHRQSRSVFHFDYQHLA
jgi:hypothetical protein